MNKKTPGEMTINQEFFINSYRYILHVDDISKVLDLITKALSLRITNLLSKTEGSGLSIAKITSFKMNYHQASVTSRLGFHVRFPVKRGRKLVYNPNSNSEEDNYCLLKCLAAFAIKLDKNKKR